MAAGLLAVTGRREDFFVRSSSKACPGRFLLSLCPSWLALVSLSRPRQGLEKKKARESLRLLFSLPSFYLLHLSL